MLILLLISHVLTGKNLSPLNLSLPRYLNTALVACLTVEAGCIKYRLKMEKYSGHPGSKNPAEMCCKTSKGKRNNV